MLHTLVVIYFLLFYHVFSQPIPLVTRCSENVLSYPETSLNPSVAFQIGNSIPVESFDECQNICCDTVQCNAITVAVTIGEFTSVDCRLLMCPNVNDCHRAVIYEEGTISVIWNEKYLMNNKRSTQYQGFDDIRTTNSEPKTESNASVTLEPSDMEVIARTTMEPQIQNDVEPAMMMKEKTIEPNEMEIIHLTTVSTGLPPQSSKTSIVFPESSTVFNEAANMTKPSEKSTSVTTPENYYDDFNGEKDYDQAESSDEITTKDTSTLSSKGNYEAIEKENDEVFSTKAVEVAEEQSELVDAEKRSTIAIIHVAANELYENGNSRSTELRAMDKSGQLEVIHLALTACGLILFGGLLLLLAYNIRTARRYQYRQLD